MVGDNRRIELPDFKRIRVAVDRFRGLRCVHTHLRGEGLTQDDLTDLALLRLDLMVAIEVNPNDGLPGLVSAAHLLPMAAVDVQNGNGPKPYAFLQPNIASQLDVDFLDLIESLEQEMARNRRVSKQDGLKDRTILVGVTTGPIADAEE
ncbi:MAG: GTPase HflX, partial [Pyrinomonadaceae bacterium]